MMTTQFKLHDTLHRYNKTPAALVQASGLAKTTVYNIVNNKAKAVELATLDKLLLGLQKLTQENFGLEDILEAKQQDDWREEIFKSAKPFNWAEIEKTLPPLDVKDEAEADTFISMLEQIRKEDTTLGERRQDQLLEILEDIPEKITLESL